MRRFTTSSGRDLIIFNERPERAAINGIFNDSAHTDTCNGDHTDVSGRCGANVEE